MCGEEKKPYQGMKVKYSYNQLLSISTNLGTDLSPASTPLNGLSEPVCSVKAGELLVPVFL